MFFKTLETFIKNSLNFSKAKIPNTFVALWLLALTYAYRVSDGHINLNFNCAFQTLLVVPLVVGFIFVVLAVVVSVLGSRFSVLRCRLFGSFCVLVYFGWLGLVRHATLAGLIALLPLCPHNTRSPDLPAVTLVLLA